MERRFRSIDFKGQMILLGTGTSVGVPAIGCDCAVCTSSNPRNNRTRSGAILGLPNGNLLFDTSPDLRHQLLREGIGMVHSVVFTHEHADHLHGLDDLRLFPFVLGHAVPLYCATTVERRIRMVFDYAFDSREPSHAAATPQLQIHSIATEPFEVLETILQPIPLIHGPNCSVLGYRIGNVAYCTDTNFISESSLELLQGLDCLVLDALRYTTHPTHFSVEEAIAVVERIKPKKTFLTHLSHDLDYESANARLPDHVQLAYDGLRIPLT